MILRHQPLQSRTAAFSCVLFDMDGTLLDSAPGVTASAAFALAAVGAPVPPGADLLRLVGPPMLESFRKFLGHDEVLAQRALKHYRQAYADYGAQQSVPYAGIREMLEQLHFAGIPLAVATSKAEDQAVRMARRFGMDHYFTSICGASDQDGRWSKADVIAEVLGRLEDANVDVGGPLMVGDRSYDVAGATVHGMPAVFASWGYGCPGEDVGAILVAASPAAVLPAVLGTEGTPGRQAQAMPLPSP
ncbi:HAD hydrolase-like protein [Arthrobacter sp. SLBN-112]|uniref:HAD hydrolase-like protein n=1 Tax=Arthrobacter sp. SLBN-112 TaxID=2768452 RepID=UPI0027B6B09E|nr:HAD hydrolase-like protein [Arthrobacter sp. SLBN-112]MDQ0802091.1 phosphoglycolate phosphatase [Arthrobacter sp. SLBN-112]